MRPTNFRLETDLIADLERIRERDGVSITEQVRRALRAWVSERLGAGSGRVQKPDKPAGSGQVQEPNKPKKGQING